MNNNQHPMPALTEQQRDKAIAFNLRRIASLENAIAVYDPLDGVDRESAINDWQFEILNHQIALATLTAEPFGWTTGKPHRDTGDATIKAADGKGRFPIYTSPPALAMRLPESVDVHHAPPAYSNAGANTWMHGANWMLAKVKRLNTTAVTEPALKPEDHAVIREIFMRTGFTISESQAELTPYVYYAATHLLHSAGYEVKRLEGGDYVAC